MNGDICQIKYIPPIGDAANIEIIDDRTVEKTVEDIGAASAHDQTEAKKLVRAKPGVAMDVAKNQDQCKRGSKGEEPAQALHDAEDPAKIADVGQGQPTENGARLAAGNGGINPQAHELAKGKGQPGSRMEKQKFFGSGAHGFPPLLELIRISKR
jgi:hypothetical protein